MIKLTGIWQNEGQKGTYFTGKLGDAKILILKNNFKNADKQPDYIMYIDEPKKKEGQQQNDNDTVVLTPEDFENGLPF